MPAKVLIALMAIVVVFDRKVVLLLFTRGLAFGFLKALPARVHGSFINM